MNVTPFVDYLIEYYQEKKVEVDGTTYPVVYESALNDVATYGCASGAGPIYTYEINRIFVDYEEEIEQIVSDYVDDAGYRNIWQAMDQAGESDTIDTARQFFVWLAWEQTAYAILNDDQHTDYVYFMDADDVIEGQESEGENDDA